MNSKQSWYRASNFLKVRIFHITRLGHITFKCRKAYFSDKYIHTYIRVGRFWVLRKVKLCVVPLGAKWILKIKKWFWSKNQRELPILRSYFQKNPGGKILKKNFTIYFWCFLDFLKSVLFDFFEGLVFIAGNFFLDVSFWILVLLNVLDLINA